MDLPSTSSQGGGNEVVRSNTVLKKTKLVRGIKSLLYSLVYDRKGKSLEKGPGIDLFIEQIIDGKCDESLSTLLDICKHVDKKSLLILEHKFYEKVKEACTALGLEIAEIVRKLSILTVSPSQNFCSQQSIFGPRRKVLDKMRDLLIEVCRMYMARDITLVTNHQRGGEEAPYRIIQKLRGDMGEVWFLKFSHNGKYLAASTSSRVWRVFGSE
ncbi:PREDICTED: uncharacterized protein LOC105951840 [Erythranthe guttata]|uniref:uncharacterized protein LOC105951840 n=1 Tax=Erythranthe guttata TaxID=4155 RepID=UPI00064DB25D|nr:PREDICTED: uncharacterized protein LOC105951840 [Erythranthe guttata]|eukprot:XP_012830754.1 PREDICTED: uncharacterized protein LOC105951840 [Erythranthe guttata]